MKIAVVGHVEWVEFARVEHVPKPGEIVHASETWEEAAGGGAVAAVQLARLGAETTLFTVLGNDELGGWMNPGGPYLAAPLPGPVEDAYGCGDCFTAGLTFALAEGRSPEEAVELGARCGAAVLTGRGAYAGQLTLAE